MNLAIIPKYIWEVILDKKNNSKSKDSELDLYINYLKENNFIEFSKNAKRNEINLNYYNFKLKYLYNYFLIIDFSSNLDYSNKIKLPQFFNLFCHINIKKIDITIIKRLCLLLDELNINSSIYLQIYIDFYEFKKIFSNDIDSYIFQLTNYNVDLFVFYNTNDHLEPCIKNGSMIKFDSVNFSNHLLCGNINETNFLLSEENIINSISENSCLNRKFSIDTEGNIKNCPSMSESFGNIRDTTLAEAIEKPGFKKYWDINKDKIHVCKDCEFRYICTDCRAYVEDPEDILSKPLKCGYNPYTGEWSEWSTNPLKQKAIDFYGMREMVDEMKESEKQV